MEMPDTTGVEPQDFQPIEEGWYKLKIEKYKEKTSREGNKYLKIWFRTDNFPGYIWGNLSYKKSSLGRLKIFKEAIGMADNETDLAGYEDVELWGYCVDDGGYATVNDYRNINNPPNDDIKDSDLPF